MYRAIESFHIPSSVAGADDGMDVLVKAGDILPAGHPFVAHAPALFAEVPDDPYMTTPTRKAAKT